MVLVDSSIWIDYFRGKDSAGTNRLDELLGTELIAVGDLMLAEVLQGFRADADYRTAKQLLTSLTVLNLLDTEIAIRSADNFRALRKKGITLRKTIDSIIATYCIEHKHVLLFADADFLPFVKFLGLKPALTIS